jgi:uncharacterized membrane protein YedE/YeeE
MRPILIALCSGTLFGAGLSVSQMTNPAKVLGFLDVAGSWDPSLAFVMGAALVVSAVAFRIQRIASGASGVGDAPPASPTTTGIDGRLLLGAATFGLGWGLAGFCPGPALAALVTGSGQVLLFVGSMIGGMGLYKLVAEPRSAAGEQEAPCQPVA